MEARGTIDLSTRVAVTFGIPVANSLGAIEGTFVALFNTGAAKVGFLKVALAQIK